MKWQILYAGALVMLLGLTASEFGCAAALPPPEAPIIDVVTPASMPEPPPAQAFLPPEWAIPFGPQPLVDYPRPLPRPGARMGRYHWTYYWITSHQAQDMRGPTRVIRDSKCQAIARVSREYYKRLRLEGTGRLKDGRLVNVAGDCDCGVRCYLVANEPFGVGVKNRPLSPFRSVAVDRRRVRIGTWLYIPELDGIPMPGEAPWGGFVHDGCVRADDVGGGVDGRHLDFFTADRAHYGSLMTEHKITRVTVHRGAKRCQKVLALRTTAAPDATL